MYYDRYFLPLYLYQYNLDCMLQVLGVALGWPCGTLVQASVEVPDRGLFVEGAGVDFLGTGLEVGIWVKHQGTFV